MKFLIGCLFGICAALTYDGMKHTLKIEKLERQVQVLRVNGMPEVVREEGK